MNRVVPENHILQLLCERAASRGHETALSFVTDSKGSRTNLTWMNLRHAALAARAALKRYGLGRGDRVLVSLPAGEAHLATILGALWGGIVPATAHTSPPTDLSRDDDWLGLIDSLRPSALVTASAVNGSGVPVLNPNEILHAPAGDEVVADFSDVQSLSYIQFTSGSTGRPRGVGLEWGAISRNLEGITRAAPLTPDDHVVTWLPMYHDMGWFGGLLAPLYADCKLTVMDVGLFVLNPLLWFRLIEDTGATITVTPPSALKTCLDLLERRPKRDLDLSSLRQVICGSEPVSPRLARRFRDVLVPRGVPEAALKPVYGLAEATLAVTFPPGSRTPRIDRIRRSNFERDQVAEPDRAGDASDTLEQISVGVPLDGVTVGIFDESGRRRPERSIGRILVKSPSLMAATIRAGALLPWKEDWLDTGDLGYLADGELFVTGRSKDLIIKSGEKISPDRLEEVACRLEEVRRAAAFGAFDDDRLTERVVLLVEPRSAKYNNAALRDTMRLSVRAEMQASGYSVDIIVLVRKGSLPLTTSGKVRRWRCRELFSAGRLDGLEGA